MDSKEKRITLFADSLALPRGKDWGNIPFEKTYPYLLEKKLRNIPLFKDFIFINKAQRFRTIVQTEKEFPDYAELTHSDIVIIHCGIVDCAPRVFTQTQRAWLEKIPSLMRRAILKFVHSFRKKIIETLCENKNYVSEDDFRNSYETVLMQTKKSGAQTIILNIITPPDSLEERSPNFQKNTKKYNEIIKSVTTKHGAALIDIDVWVQNNGGHAQLTYDGMHINELGHAYVYEQLEKLITTP